MAITAPFRFARINRKVYFPKWCHLVSHDVPFADGYSGEIALSIVTQTPLLVGGKRTSGINDEPGTVEPFLDGDDNWAIPGSSIQGMIRQILEIAAFGKLGPNVKDQRFGVRDISNSLTAKNLYRGRLQADPNAGAQKKVKSGWLIRTPSGRKIVECQSDRIDISALNQIFPGAETTLEGRTDAKERLESVTGKGNAQDLSKLEWLHEGKSATIVLTGKTQAGLNDRAKKREFVFFGKSRKEIMDLASSPKGADVSDDVWRDFRLIHEPDTGRNAVANPNWEFWKPYFEKGEPVPVFYLEEGGQITAIGTAQMFKLAMSLSTHEMLKHSSEDHADREQYDLPSLIFGAIGGSDQKDSWFSHGLKRRAAFDLFKGRKRDTEKEQETAENSQTLLAPKPNYYPIYVRQNGMPKNGRPYSAYHSMPYPDAALHSPELAGVKIWPSSGETRLAQANGQPSISNKLKTVPKGEKFTGSLRVHNLREVELGALLWALTYGEEGRYTHRLGGGKPLGFGEIRIGVEELRLHSNMRDKPLASTESLIKSFVDQMVSSVGENWRNSSQIKALLQAATPTDADYSYVEGRGHTGYREEREKHHIFDDYVPDGFEPARDNEELITAQQNVKQQKKAQVELAKLAAEAAKPHLAFADHISANFANRHEPPTEFSGHPPVDAFAIGERVMLNGGVKAIIIGYPALRSHPAEIKKTKWLVGFTNAGGTKIVEERKQSEIAKT